MKGRDIQRGEKLFSSQRWEQRTEAMRAVARLIMESPCRAFVVVVDKRDLPEYVATDTDLYRIAFWLLLDILEAELVALHDDGLLMADMRSDLHSSVQDRRLIDAFQDWVASRAGQTHFVQVPWFGFSAFYAGLQLADFVAYLTDVASGAGEANTRQQELHDAFALLQSKVRIVRIP
ncbi:MAG: DUF3800 domain-containing protein [Chloroflexi bacterium]|nr:DUF3800 domain-containing protein [Chloroflexota bacterium]